MGTVGAATAIILAPQSGQETRSKLANKSNELLQSGGARVQQVRETAGSYGHDYLEKASWRLSSTRQQVQDVGDVCRKMWIVLDKGKEQASQLGNRVNGTDETNQAE